MLPNATSFDSAQGAECMAESHIAMHPCTFVDWHYECHTGTHASRHDADWQTFLGTVL